MTQTDAAGTGRIWQSVWVELLGAEVKHYRGRRFTTRAIEMGQGEPLILMHGIGGHAEAYARNVRTLAQHFHVYSVDMMFHGFTSKEPYNRADIVSCYAEWMLDFVDAIGAKQVHIEGESLGAFVAYYFALRYPGRCGRLIFNTGAPVRYNSAEAALDEEAVVARKDLAERSLAAIRNLSRETIRKRLEWLMADPSQVTDELVEIRYQLYRIPEINAAVARTYEHVFLGGGVDQLFLPEETGRQLKPASMVFWTDKNPGEGPEVGKRFAELIDRPLYVMKNAGHWPQWEHPEEHDRVVIDFVKRG
jgi:pimeloyl-ACP methyl ester carboxylesterase